MFGEGKRALRRPIKFNSSHPTRFILHTPSTSHSLSVSNRRELGLKLAQVLGNRLVDACALRGQLRLQPLDLRIVYCHEVARQGVPLALVA